MASYSPRINLVKKRRTFLEKFITWSLTAGRVVVIVTEGIALFAFLYRFSLDQQIIDLHGQIKQKQTIILLLKSNEDTFRNLQQRMAMAKKISSSSSDEINIFKNINLLVPAGISVSNFGISSGNIKIDATASSIEALSSFARALKENKTITSVSLDKVENRTSTATIGFGISAKLKE